ncbi:MAG: HNH endonuclease [Candidatus Cloacimonetes bacterium]|nr:HNH endonuclease [Candidatus Cloacimonadota bacterium]
MFRKDRIPWNKGLTKETDERVAKCSKPHSKKWNEKISKAKKGRAFSVKHKKNISISCKGKLSHRKGITLEEEYGIEKAKEIKQKISIRAKKVMNRPEVKKKCGWSKGLTKETDLRVKHQGDSRKGRVPHNKGLTFEKEYGIDEANKLKQQISDSMKKAFENDPSLYEKSRSGRKGKESPMKGKQRSPETKEKIKKALANLDPDVKRRKIEAISGERNHNWRGGISNRPYGYKFKKLKKKILQRDDYICQFCFITNKEHKEKVGDSLHCHHIDYDRQNCEENNLITLCSSCNASVNFNRKYWTNYFQTLLSVVDEEIYLMELC